MIAITDEYGKTVAKYAYDAWGRHLSISGSIAPNLGQYNPFRYRGYIYDSETQLYYLQSRYYDPEIGRFINADAYTSTSQGMLGNNMYAYCGNNPVMRSDISGCFWNSAIDQVVESFKRLKETLEQKELGTIMCGINLSAAVGVSLGFTFGYTYDYKGNIGFFATPSGGVGLPTIGASLVSTQTSAPDIYSQSGPGENAGGSGGEAVTFGGEYNMLIDTEAGKTYHGLTLSVGTGLAFPSPVEFHCEKSTTYVAGISLFDLAIDILNSLRWDG